MQSLMHNAEKQQDTQHNITNSSCRIQYRQLKNE
jgi:uncharacterized membrane protein